MIFVGERINTGFADIKQAVMDKNPGPLQYWAREQTKAGANYLDVNLGAVSSDPQDMCWMIETVQAAVDTPISIDTNKMKILAEAVKVCRKPPLINSTTAALEKLGQLLPLVAEYRASIIGLVMDESGAPKSAGKRVEHAGTIIATAMEHDISPERIFLDPIVMPLKYMQDQAREILDAVRQFTLFSDPPPNIICGLSNVSSGTVHKRLLNRTFLGTAIVSGLSAVICDVLDDELVNAARAAELIMNREIFADSFVRA